MKKTEKKIYIFGAHSRARTTAKYLTELNDKLIPLGYLVDNEEFNEAVINGIPVIDLRTNPDLDTTASVYIGTRGVNFTHAARALSALGFSDILPVDNRLDTELRTKYFENRFKAEGKEFIKINDLNVRAGSTAIVSDSEYAAQRCGSQKKGHSDLNTCIFEVRSVYDKPLIKDRYVRAPYEKSIQVGTSLTEIRLEECLYYDNEGDNISDTNRQLCEITALYWIWKHSTFNIVGLVHYRRHFIFPERWIERMTGNDVDIILPLPLYIEPSVEENYRFRHISSDWDQLLQFMEKHHTDQMEAVQSCFSNTYYYPCNMFVMKNNVFEEYCSWLFPILFYVMEKVGNRKDVYQNRYPAFMAERLLTLFCYINRDKFKIVFADKNFLE